MITTISGVAGSGKSSVAKILAKELEYTHYSTGDMQREIAKEKGLTIVELGELEKKDPSIDNMIDAKVEKLGKEKDNFVFDSWLAPLFIPNSFKIFLDTDIETRAKRICMKREAESYTNIEDAKLNIVKRENSNRERWMRYYNYDFKDLNNYDAIIDCSKISIEETVKLIKEKLPKNL
ncbi:AAA family ATPase [archaeon]|nr:AAA family ATPase [archaeon]